MYNFDTSYIIIYNIYVHILHINCMKTNIVGFRVCIAHRDFTTYNIMYMYNVYHNITNLSTEVEKKVSDANKI